MRNIVEMLKRPMVRLVGQGDHPDFQQAMELLRADAHLATDDEITKPELIVIAQSRPGEVGQDAVQQLQRRSPLAGAVALLGSWCEGESRTGRPWPGVARLYWYEFPAWWRRQLALRASGRCPDWARPGEWEIGSRIADYRSIASAIRNSPSTSRDLPSGVIVLSVPTRDTREALSDILCEAGFATVWQRNGQPECDVHGAAAGIWDGGQLDEREADGLAIFCRKLSRDAAPVIALLDFPRRDRVQRARELGAAAVLGKPWRNEALLATLQTVMTSERVERAA